MRVVDLLGEPPQFLTPGHTVEHAARRMLVQGSSLIPICRPDGVLVGVLDERDIVVKAVALSRAPELCSLGEIMRREYPTCALLEDARDVYARMLADGSDRLPVIDRAGKLMGIVERSRLSVAASARPTPRRLRKIA